MPPPPFTKYFATPLPALVAGEKYVTIGLGPPTLEKLPPSLSVPVQSCVRIIALKNEQWIIFLGPSV